jgi:hypothetical protein
MTTRALERSLSRRARSRCWRRHADDDPGLSRPRRLLACRRAAVGSDGRLSFRLANRAVGNPAGAAALEITLSGPTLKFNTEALICLGGAEMAADWTASRSLLDPSTVPRRRVLAHRRASRMPAAAPIWRCAAASTCPSIWAAARPSRWANSAAMAAGAAPAMCCIWARLKAGCAARDSRRRARPHLP